MAYDFLGTLIQNQWTALQSLVIAALKEAKELISHLEKEIKLQDKFAAKLLLADHVCGGTSSTGFDGASYLPEDRQDNAVGEIRSRQSKQINPLAQFLLDNAPDRKSYVQSVDMSNGSFCAGDLPWMDLPQTPQMSNPMGAFDDLRTAPIVDYLKQAILPQIRYLREQLEYRVKSALDYREQLLIRIFDLQQAESKADSFIQQVSDQFVHVDEGTDINDPQAKPITEKPEPLVSSRKTGEATLHRHLWKSYPPTRIWPTWPLMPPSERGNSEILEDSP